MQSIWHFSEKFWNKTWTKVKSFTSLNLTSNKQNLWHLKSDQYDSPIIFASVFWKLLCFCENLRGPFDNPN